jgi:IS605 OrfB family transposase
MELVANIKAIVLETRRAGGGIGLEDLKSVRERVKASRPHRARFGHRSFGELQTFVVYKARPAGAPVLFVDRKYSRKGCPACKVIDADTRLNQVTFS